jgi:hypothetical protein
MSDCSVIKTLADEGGAETAETYSDKATGWVFRGIDPREGQKIFRFFKATKPVLVPTRHSIQ